MCLGGDVDWKVAINILVRYELAVAAAMSFTVRRELFPAELKIVNTLFLRLFVN